MKLIKLLLQNSKLIIAQAVFAGIISGLVSSSLVVLVHLQLERLDDLSLILPILFGVACILRLFTGFYSQLILIRLGQNAIYDLRLKLSKSILSAPLIYLEKIGNPSLKATLIDDVNSIAQTLIIIPMIGVNLALISGCLLYLGYLSAFSVIICLVFVGIWFLSVHLISQSAQKYLYSARQATDKLYQALEGLTEGVKELKLDSSRRSVFWSKELQSSAEELKSQTVKAEIIFTLAANWSRLIIFILVGVLLFLLVRFIKTDVGTISGVMLTLLFIMSQLDIILNQLPQLGKAETALGKIDSLQFSLDKNSPDTSFQKDVFQKLETSLKPFKSLELKNLQHTYRLPDEERNFTLGEINLRIKAGELIFIVGGNGSGKTTLAKLILGLYQPEKGEILWNDEAVCEKNREFYRENFGVILSDFHLFENLPCNISPEQALVLLKKLQLIKKVEIRENKFSTLQLSQGQRKRLALLSVYAQNKNVYLFDEWAADQDPLFKEIFYQEVLFELKSAGKTLIVITHDDKYFHLADRLIKIENGQIIAEVGKKSNLGKP